MIRQDVVDRLYDCQVIDPRGEKIGAVKRVWLDERTGDPAWASVHTGLFGLKESFVPLQRAELRDDELRVPVDKEQVRQSPRIEATNDHMTDDEQAALYRHYGFGPQGSGPDGAGQRPGQQPGQWQGQRQVRRPGSTQQASDYANHGRDVMTRSEERLRVGTERVETGKVRLVKHVVTERQRVDVPVSHEEVRVEREPITAANRDAAMRGPKIDEAEHEVTLHAEKPVVSTETVPMEQVRLTKDTVPDERSVSGELRKERIEVQDSRANRRRQ
ncbi:DUF2382 domain-containing protein [Actinophytocola sp.]|uniref:DUF2382 domain-containing protein n=1 Tax=Actinophytocola sp. TaxID=1872138 RepID=UPI00389B38E1